MYIIITATITEVTANAEPPVTVETVSKPSINTTEPVEKTPKLDHKPTKEEKLVPASMNTSAVSSDLSGNITYCCVAISLCRF